MVGRTDAGEHQELGRVDGAAGENHLVGQDVLEVAPALMTPNHLDAERSPILDRGPG